MRKIFSQILAIIFLLVIAGSKVIVLTQNAPIDTTVVGSQSNSLKTLHHKVLKGNQQNSNLTTIQLDDVSDSEASDGIDFLTTYSKIVVFAFLLSFLNTKFKKRRFFYDAFIRLFSQKYIVLRTLRI